MFEGIQRTIEIVDQILNERERVRDEVLKVSRDIIRKSKMLIKNVYLNRSDSGETLKELRELKKKLMHLISSGEFLKYSNLVTSVLTEYVEAEIVFSVIVGEDIPSFEDLGVDVVPYVLGFADAVAELRRFILEYLRRGNVELSVSLLEKMESLYLILCQLEYSDAILPGFRRKCDVIRRLVDETKSDIIFMRKRLNHV